MDHYDVVIAGGGIAGLTSAISLSRSGFRVLVIEKKSYPFHRVCGEYISNEVLPYLRTIGADPLILEPAKINMLAVSSNSGRILKTQLKQGGFGLSRYTFDLYLYNLAKQAGTDFLLNTKISSVEFNDPVFITTTESHKPVFSDLVIGSFGKRSNLDKQMNRDFFSRKSPYIGVKYHIVTDHPANEIALHNFSDGYCGISRTESESYCLCYLTTRENLRKYGTVPAMEEAVLCKNPHLKKIFTESNFLYKKPEVINEISFDKKSAFENNILMCGDSSGMITPLCGNGMAIAIHSSAILTRIIRETYKKGSHNVHEIGTRYNREWNRNFNTRLLAGRTIQKLTGNTILTDLVISGLKLSKPVTNWLIRQTHGNPF